MQIDVGALKLTSAHRRRVMKALKSNRLSYGPMTAEFETKFARIHGNKYGVFTNSGTSALQATIHAMKILYKWRDGDEIIMPATTFVATYNVILHNNLKPVLVDVDSNLNINPLLIEEKITKKTRAIMPVHLLGKPANMSLITKIAKKYKLKTIEDSCESMFVKYIGEGDVACFSFYVAHLLVTGVGGLAITNDKELADMIRSLIFHGRDNLYLKLEDDDVPTKEIVDARFRFLHPGYSSRGTEVEAALGLVELENYGQMLFKRRRNALMLAMGLGNYNAMPFSYYTEPHSFMMFPMLVIARDKLMMFLEKQGITTRTLMPLINQPYIKAKGFPKSEDILKHGLLMGCHQHLTIKDIRYIIRSIKEFYD